MAPPDLNDPRIGPLPSVRRLPLYLRVLKDFRSAGRQGVSCTHISEALRFDPTQVRKDLAITGIVGRPKVGYDINELIRSIEDFLGWRKTTDAILVGVGSLGTALLGFSEFSNLGLNLIAAFDVDPRKIGTHVHGRQVLSLNQLKEFTTREQIRIGVLTVPRESAQQVAETMVNAGIQAIWNFSITQLVLPPQVIVECSDLSSSLAALTSRLRASRSS